MSVLSAIVREFIGLFVDDGALALAIVAIVIAAGVIAAFAHAAWASGGVLLFGCLGVLAVNVMTAKRR